MEPSGRVRSGRAKFWLLAAIGGLLIVTIVAGVILAINFLLGRSLENSLPTLAISVIGLGPYVGALIKKDRERQGPAQT